MQLPKLCNMLSERPTGVLSHDKIRLEHWHQRGMEKRVGVTALRSQILVDMLLLVAAAHKQTSTCRAKGTLSWPGSSVGSSTWFGSPVKSCPHRGSLSITPPGKGSKFAALLGVVFSLSWPESLDITGSIPHLAQAGSQTSSPALLMSIASVLTYPGILNSNSGHPQSSDHGNPEVRVEPTAPPISGAHLTTLPNCWMWPEASLKQGAQLVTLPNFRA